MKKTIWIMGLSLIFGLGVSQEQGGNPVGRCPEGGNWHLHQLHHHEGMPTHKHVGNDKDQNGDGYICAKHVSPDGSIHVHKDNTKPL